MKAVPRAAVALVVAAGVLYVAALSGDTSCDRTRGTVSLVLALLAWPLAGAASVSLGRHFRPTAFGGRRWLWAAAGAAIGAGATVVTLALWSSVNMDFCPR
jgi:hypothetical protein